MSSAVAEQSSDELLVARDGAVVSLTLNRPQKLNALSESLVEQIHLALDAAERNGLRLLVLRGEGRNFSAGFDFGGYESQSEGDLLRRFVRIEALLQRVHHASYDTLALAHGRNFGAGVDLFAACNRRVCTADSTFRMPGLGFGLVLGTRRFARLVGESWARQVLHDGVTFNGAEAAERGFATSTNESGNWPSDIKTTAEALTLLDDDARARLFHTIHSDTRAMDMADLVASAARPGLTDRLRAYRQSLGK